MEAQRDRHVTVPIWLFVAGYMLVWGAAGVLVYVLVQIGSDVVITLASPDRATSGPLALGATLIVAGLYQFTQIKRVCLRHCRSPLGFMAQFWRDGWFGALGMGGEARRLLPRVLLGLFAGLVAAGMMSLAWMPLLALLVFAEKAFPHGRHLIAVIGIASIVLGLLVAGSAVSMPWRA